MRAAIQAKVQGPIAKTAAAFLLLFIQSSVNAATLEDLIKQGAIPPLPKRTLAKILINRTEDNGRVTAVLFSERAPMTRSAIHAHDHGGVTCLIQGEMTLFVEGRDPIVREAGECYYMPPGVHMTGVNTGKEVAKFFDYFNYKAGESLLRVVEGGGCGSVRIDLSEFCDDNPYIKHQH